MATKPSHKRPHKFKQRKVVEKKHNKVIRKRAVSPQRKKQEIENQGSFSITQAPDLESTFAKPYIQTSQPPPQTVPQATSSQEYTVVTPQPQQAQVQSNAQGQEPQPIIAPPTLSENPTQSASTKQTSGVSATTVSQEKAIPTPQVVLSGSSENKPPLENTTPEHKKSKLWIILAFVVIIAIAGGGLYYFRQEVMLKSLEKKEEPTPTPSQISEPEESKASDATESAEIKADPSQYSIKVLNGSGTAGVAAEVRDILEEADFIVEDIGNADASNYEKTIIRAKENVSKEFLDVLREELGKLYLLDENETLEESEDVDVIVVIGREDV